MVYVTSLLQNLRHLRLWRRNDESGTKRPIVPTPSVQVTPPVVDISPDDPIVAYFLATPGAVEVDKLNFDSPTLRALKKADIKLAIPLISQGELVGLLNLGPRRSEQEYSAYDRGLLNTLAAQASPAVRVAQMVREQQAAALERERLGQELRVARLIQQTLLPQDLPALPGWHFSAYYMAARAVGGDFYDFLYFEDGQLGIVIGDVTDKGVPAALLMATTRSILRSAAVSGASPGKVLERTNTMLFPDIPPRMFVTCLYAILDPRTGRLRFANAGHDLPYRMHKQGVSELRATGMPLGLMPGMTYEEKETYLMPGEAVLFYSDGLVEAHNQQREMFGFPRLMRLLAEFPKDANLIELLLEHLKTFTGNGWEQEDDVTLVTLYRPTGISGLSTISTATALDKEVQRLAGPARQTLTEIAIPSAPGNERTAMQQVAEAVASLALPERRLERLKTAVAEATMNAMEHGNNYQTDVPVSIQVQVTSKELTVRIKDRGGKVPIPEPEPPDIEAKLAELQTQRGWGLFLIKNLVDDVRITNDETQRIIELIMYLEGNRNADTSL